MSLAAFLVFDVESIGLHGEGFAVGYVVIDREGNELAARAYATSPDAAKGTAEGRAWIAEHVTPTLGDVELLPSPAAIRHEFWADWTTWARSGTRLAADVAWPVEARFLNACIDDNPTGREWEGPYPLVDIASVRLAAGLNPLATEARFPSERPAHHPLADARQSARLLIEALARCGDRA